MAEIFQKDGTWTFDGSAIRVVPGGERGVHLVRRTLGELTVPLEAVAGIAFEPGRKNGRLRLRLREGADPLSQVTRGRMSDAIDPYQLRTEPDRSGVAEYFAEEVRTALLLEQVPDGPADRYLLSGPAVPMAVGAGDGTASFDGERVRLDWNWVTDEGKASGGPRELALSDIRAVEWLPSIGLENGYLRFVVPGAPAKGAAKYDPNAIELFGFKKDGLMALLGAAVAARLPHPSAPAHETPAPPALPRAAADTSPASPADPADDHDTLLRRLRELGELHRSGILTDEEFTAAKQAILQRF
ncbi:DUF4429 domain-containing protein [Streptomyces sp. I05A-00742]|uniref:DUF4429 domain-containing protein n=1 Tax=Streptomyces sp. I05A-00742 TaxID=2732853 RepID=UPI001489C69E|nr:DUF4429 domain-containing protein [Streptomyces sp. I05A-00742]